jgi:putative FmdB family regulatory protein
MPLYEFSCARCDHTFEALVFDGEKVECPECHGQRVKRLLSVPAKPHSQALPLGPCGDPSLPPCGAPGCRRTGKA